MTERPLRVLCLDIEGGYGGSSRSLYESVRFIDRSKVDFEIWCRRTGPIQARYEAIGVVTQTWPSMPKVSALLRLSRNLFVHCAFLRDWFVAREFRHDLRETVNDRFDLVHFNHEALHMLARWLQPRVTVPFTMHIRTNLHDTPFARHQNRSIASTIDHLVFITENERATFERLAGGAANGTVIHNIASWPASGVAPHPNVPVDDRYKIASLSNFSWLRGVDRLVDVAEALANKGRRNVLFVVAGNMTLTRSLPGRLGAIARRGGGLADYVRDRRLDDMFLFLDHVDEPESVLLACDALAKPTRECNPWGRDIIEAMAAGKPVLTCGEYDKFVEDGVTGFLQPKFDAVTFARKVVALADDRSLSARLGAEGRKRAERHCGGADRSADLMAVWCAVAAKH